MNLAKARDYFSAYYEGSLDRGLKQSFEARLKEDAQLQAEYKAFDRTMKGLEALGHIEIEPPADLHERIAARLDRAIYEQKREKSSVFSLNWLRGLGILGAAAIAVLLVLGVKGHFDSNQANILGIGSADAPRFVFTAHNHSVTMSYAQVDHQTILLKDGTGKVLHTITLDHQSLSDDPIQNDENNAQLVSVETADESSPITYVALPGKVADPSTSGKGAITDLAVALAAHYQHPVVVQAAEAAKQDASWDFSGNDPIAAAAASVRPLTLVVSQDPSGFISITKS